MNRPDWASGPEWDGWDGIGRSVGQSIDEFVFCEIARSGEMTLIDGEDTACMLCDSPGAARKAAEALMEACNG